MGNDVPDLMKLDRSHIKPAAEVLAKAFMDYPIDRFSFPNIEDRAKKSHYMHQFVLSCCIQYGEAYSTSDKFEGIAAWLPPENAILPIWKLIRSGALIQLSKFGISSIRKMMMFNRYLEMMHKRIAPYPHWYLWNIGVDPQFQGKGYAGKLLLPMLARMDEEGVPCYLETQREENVALYRHYGFEVADRFVVPVAGFTNWSVVRDPSNKMHI